METNTSYDALASSLQFKTELRDFMESKQFELLGMDLQIKFKRYIDNHSTVAIELNDSELDIFIVSYFEYKDFSSEPDWDVQGDCAEISTICGDLKFVNLVDVKTRVSVYKYILFKGIHVVVLKSANMQVFRVSR